LLALVLCLTVPMRGQLYTGSIAGQVTDPSGAMVPQAQVIATDTERQYVYTATTDTTGSYTFRSLPPGQYTVSVEAAGFSRYVREKFAVDVNSTVTVDARLQLKGGAQSVIVSDTEAPLLQTQTGAIGQQVDRKFINDLPLVNRALFDLVSLAPGINPPAGQTFGPGTVNPTDFSSNGGRNMQSDVLLDGTSITSIENNGGNALMLYVPTVDAIEEFKVQQGNFSAEYGFSGGAVINAVTRSGTDTYHGSGYGFLRNRVLDANNFFTNAAGQPLPNVSWKDFGGTFGGPVRIPKVYNGKDKTFFFVAYDTVHQASASSSSGGVPSAAELTGNFGELCKYAGGTFNSAGMCSNPAGQIWDPFSAAMDANGNAILNSAGNAVRQNYIPFDNIATYISPGNQYSPQGHLPHAPGNLLDPVAMKLAAYYPQPNLNVGTAAYNPYNNWYGSGAAPSTNADLDIKGDHRFNERNFLSIKVSEFQGTSTNGANLFGNAGDTHTQGFGHGLTETGTINYTNTINPNTVLVIMGGVTYGRSANQNLLNSTYSNLSPVGTLGMPAYMADSGYNSFPQSYLGQNYQNVGSQAWSNFTTGYMTRHLLGSLSRMTGKHDLKVGAEARFRYMNMLFNGEPAGVFNFSQFGSAQQEGYGGGAGGGDAMATFLMGDNDGWGGYEIPVRPATSSKQTSMYVQDNWKANERLTLNLGLRYDIELPRTERYNRMSYFNPYAPPPPEIANVPGEPNLEGAVEYVGVNGNPRTISPIYWHEIQPRFGFAYRLRRDTSIRGGYGIYYDQSLTGVVGLGVTSFNGWSMTTNNVNYLNGNLGVPASFLRNPYPQGISLPQGAAGGPGVYLGTQFGAPIPGWNAIPQEQSWSFDVQHQLPGSFLLDLGYVGKKGTRLYMGGVNALDYLSPAAAAQFQANPAAATAQVANPFYGYIPGESQTVSQYQLWVPYPQYPLNGNAAAITGPSDPRGSSIYHALQIKLEKRLSAGLQMLTSYVWSKSIDDASVISSNTTFLGGSVSVQDPNNLRGERSLSQFNIPQVFQLAFVYQLPFGHGKKFGGGMNWLADMVAGGWQLNTTYRWDDGQPLAIGLNSSVPLPTYGAQRPDMLGELKQNPGVNINAYFANPQVITTPPPYMDGDESRTDPHLRAPGANVMSASLFKDFPLHFREGARLQFRAEFFNVLNHPQFAAPNTTFGSSTFGMITSQANVPRTGQLALKFYF